ncbi:MAG: (d)CMP kinase, partial [Prevotellaceae bacterium]|nr:(d)CMP kinase [Prevotellaceae bacterium]
NELLGKGISSTLEEVEKNLKERDYIDENRAISPLRRAADALILDNSNLTLEQEMEWVVEIIEERRAE